MSKKCVFVPRGLWTPILSILEGPEAPWERFWALKGGGTNPNGVGKWVREAPGQGYKS